MNADRLIETYVRLRDKKAELAAKHKAELEPVEAGMMKLESMLLALLDETGADKVSGPHGTAFTKVNTSVTVADWDAVVGYVQEHGAYDLLERRVAKTAAMERGDVPGLNVSQIKVVQIRRK